VGKRIISSSCLHVVSLTSQGRFPATSGDGEGLSTSSLIAIGCQPWFHPLVKRVAPSMLELDRGCHNTLREFPAMGDLGF
jgi:hypothetical protein